MKVHYMSKTYEWATPIELFNELNREFHFTLDPCATDKNAKCAKYYTLKENGLMQDWSNEMVFMNPPYGREIGYWVKKLSQNNGVALLPARTDTHWFHSYIYNKAEIRFIKGRIKFGDSKNSAPFPSMIVIFKN